MMKITNQLVQLKHKPLPIEQLIENRRIYHAENAELNVYETYTPAQAIELEFSTPVLVSMLQGRKVMHLSQTPSFDFLPEQSILLPPNERMKIDFPDASLETPTRCLALAIDPELIKKTLAFLNEEQPRIEENGDWKSSAQNFYLLHDKYFDMAIHRLVQLFLEQHAAKSILIDLSLKEIIIRLLKTNAQQTFLGQYQKSKTSNRLTAAAQYIQENLHKEICIEDLCSKVHMSKPNLFRYFQNEFGVTPIEYINHCRIGKAKEILKNPLKTISDACYETGYNSLSYFTKVFKKTTGITPKQFKI